MKLTEQQRVDINMQIYKWQHAYVELQKLKYNRKLYFNRLSILTKEILNNIEFIINNK